MKIERMEATYELRDTKAALIEKRGFRTVESKYVDGTEVRLQRRDHEVLERIVVGYDRFGRAVYGSLVPQRSFEVRDRMDGVPQVPAP